MYNHFLFISIIDIVKSVSRNTVENTCHSKQNILFFHLSNEQWNAGINRFSIWLSIWQPRNSIIILFIGETFPLIMVDCFSKILTIYCFFHMVLLFEKLFGVFSNYIVYVDERLLYKFMTHE